MADAENELPDEAMPVFAWPDPELFLATHYGLSGEIEPLPGDPPSYLVRYDEVVSRLDFCSDPDKARQFEAQAALLLHMHPETGRIEGPRPLETGDGILLCTFEADEDYREGYARVCAYPAGISAPPSVNGAILGGFAARLIRDLAAAAEDARDEEMPALWSASDLRQAGPSVVKILREVRDATVRDPIAKAMVAALRRVQALGPELRSQLIHHKPVAAELVGAVTEEVWQPTGFVDPASLGEGWVVASLAAVCADQLLGRPDDDMMAFLPAVEAFHAELPLTEAEVKALWPLIIARIGLIRAAAERARVTDGLAEDPWLLPMREAFDRATAMQPAIMEAAIRHVLDWPLRPQPEFGPLLPEIDPEKIRLADLSTASTAFFEGNWRDPENDWRLLAKIAWDTKMGATRFGEYRLSRSHAQMDGRAENYALHVDLCLPAGTVALAPFGGLLQLRDGRLLLNSPEACLHLEGLETVLSDGTALFAGDRLGVVAGSEGSVGGLRIRLSREAQLVPPLFVSAQEAGLWRQLALSPSAILGIDVDAPQAAERAFVRGWREHVFDATGRPFIDLTGGAGLLGHGHSGLAEAAYHQWLLLNGLLSTPVEAEFQAALRQRLPGELDTVVALTGEAAAMELAQQLGGRLFSEDEPPRIADERRTGFGRTGKGFWAFEANDTVPDIVVTGSPVPGEPLAAVVMRRSSLPQDLDLPQPDASMVACRLGSAVIDMLDDPELSANATVAAGFLEQTLTAMAEASGGRLALSGAGLAVELWLSGLSATELSAVLLDRAIIATAMDDSRLQLTAPLCIARSSLDYLVEALSDVLGIPVPQAAPRANDEPPEEQVLQSDGETPI